MPGGTLRKDGLKVIEAGQTRQLHERNSEHMAYPGSPSNRYPDPDLSDYALDTLHRNGEFVLCRGRLRTATSAHPPSVLLLMLRSEHPRPESVRMLEHEHSLRAELDRAWAVPPVALTQHEGRTVLVLKDPGGEPLDRLAGTPMGMEQFLRVAISLSAAVRQLHGRGLIHKDLKPANVMIEANTGQVWLMGFGIASRVPRERQSAEPPEFIAGTLAYMAPEQTGRMNRSIDSRSDLYALGVTLYEMLTGTLPFTASDPMEWVHCHIAKQPLPPAERSKRCSGTPYRELFRSCWPRLRRNAIRPRPAWRAIFVAALLNGTASTASASSCWAKMTGRTGS